MGFWDILDVGIGCIPIVGTVKDAIQAGVAAIQGDHEKAKRKLLEASIGVVLDVVTVASLGTASGLTVAGKAAAKGAAQQVGKRVFVKEVAKVTAGRFASRMASRAIDQTKQDSEPESEDPRPEPEDPEPESSDSESESSDSDSESEDDEHYVIEKSVLRLFKDIIEKYIFDRPHRFFGLSYKRLVAKGYIAPSGCLSKSHDEPLSDEVKKNIESVMKVDIDQDAKVVDPTYVIYSASLFPVCFDILENVIQDIVETGKPLTSNRYILNRFRLLSELVKEMNQETVPPHSGIYVNEQARSLWVAENPEKNKVIFTSSREAVSKMLTSLTHRGQDSPRDSLLYKWAQELHSVIERLNNDHHVEDMKILHHLATAPIISLAQSEKPTQAAMLGHQTDGAPAGDLWCAVANTKWGKIPGKAKDDTCWYAKGGHEYSTSDFKWLDSPCTLQMVKDNGSVPHGAVWSGLETDGDVKLYSAIAETKWGKIPGKVEGNMCFYSYDTKQYEASEFYWVVRGTRKIKNPLLTLERHRGPSEHALRLGHQTDGAAKGSLWSAVADTERGLIPGKAKDDTCWYTYGGEEYHTSTFYWLESTHTAIIETVPNQGHPPFGAVMSGWQNDGTGDQFAAVANTKWGKIPGKARDNTCHYPYEGKEYHTSDFEWVVVNKSIIGG